MATESSLPLAQYRRFESFKEYEALFDELIVTTQSVIRVFERTLPPTWNTSVRITRLRKFLRDNTESRLYIIVHDASSVTRTLPRITDLARDFGHAFKLRQTPRMAQHLYDPFSVFDASHYLHRFHYAHMRAAIGTHDVENARDFLDRHEELWALSTPATLAGFSGL